jgi:hypothetical protein
MASNEATTPAAVDNLAVRGGYRGPKARGRGPGRSGGQQRQQEGNDQSRPPAAITCFRCGKQGHIAQECRAPASAIVAQPGPSRGQGRPPHTRQGSQRPVANIDTANLHSARPHSPVGRWHPSYLPEFDQAEGAAETAYSGGYYAQEELAMFDSSPVVRETH